MIFPINASQTHHDGQDRYGERSLFDMLNSGIYGERAQNPALRPTELAVQVVAQGPFAVELQGSHHACRGLASTVHRFLGGAFLEAERETFDG